MPLLFELHDICNVRRPKVVTSAHSSVRPIVTLAVTFENSFVEARRIILKVSTIQRSKVFMRKTSKIVQFMEGGGGVGLTTLGPVGT